MAEAQGAGRKYLEGLNCAEAILQQANEDYNLGLTPEALRMATGFGSGMVSGLTCGALTAGVMVISALYGRTDRDEDAKRAKVLTHRFVQRFQEAMRGLDCNDLIPIHRSAQHRCAPLVTEGYALLQKVLAEGAAE